MSDDWLFRIRAFGQLNVWPWPEWAQSSRPYRPPPKGSNLTGAQLFFCFAVPVLLMLAAEAHKKYKENKLDKTEPTAESSRASDQVLLPLPADPPDVSPADEAPAGDRP
jgi:hypothetical protein